MMNNGKKKHLIIAAVLLIYLISAKPLYDQFILRNGKPEREIAALPAQADSQEYVFRMAAMRQVRHEGQDLYELRGFVFPSADPQMKNRISLVLSAPDRTLVYSSRPVPAASMLRSFRYPQAVNEQAEFRVLVAKQALPTGLYQVGLLLEEEGGAQQAYLATGRSIEKTPNRIRYRVLQ